MTAGTERFSGDTDMTVCTADAVFPEEAAVGRARLPTVESLTDHWWQLKGGSVNQHP